MANISFFSLDELMDIGMKIREMSYSVMVYI